MLRTERLLLTGLVAVYLGMAVAYSWVKPPLEGFDSVAHYRAAVHLRRTGELPRLDRAALDASYELIAQPLLYHGLAAVTLLPWSPSPAWAYTEQVPNAYFDKGLSKRQTIRPANAAWAAVAPTYAAAWVSVLGGLLAVYATWRLARRFAPAQPTFALAAAAVVGFNPIFLFLATSVTNDVLSVGALVMTVALAAEAVLPSVSPAGATATDTADRSPRRWLWIGMWGGLAALSKYSGLLVGLPVALLWVYGWRRAGWRYAWRALGWALAAGLLVAGWWFGRMFLLYGEVIPLGRMQEVISTLNYATPMAWSTVWSHVPWLIWSYWGVFVAIIAPAAFFSVVRWLMVGGALGLGVALLRRDGQGYAAKAWLLALVLLWACAVALAVLYWTRTVSYGAQGRLAHIGAPAFALALVTGWQSYLPWRWRPLVHVALSGLMVGLALWQVQTLAQAHAQPQPVSAPEPQRPLRATFEGGPVLLGADFPEGAAARPSETLPVRLYWTTERVIQEDLTLFLHLADEDDRLLVQFDGVPDGGRHPTRQWQPGEVFIDAHRLAIPADAQPGLAALSLGFYPIESPGQRQPVFDAQGTPAGDRVMLADVQILPPSPAAPAADRAETGEPLAVWQEGITLLSADVVADANANTETAPGTVRLRWRSRETLHRDYTLFVQVLDAENQVLAQADQRAPRPTGTWRAGDRVSTTMTLTPASDSVPDPWTRAMWTRVIVGWYDGAGNRLTLVQDNELVQNDETDNGTGQDFYVIATREDE